MYLNYNEYINMQGTLDESTFNHLEIMARQMIAKRTFNRLGSDKDIPLEVKECVFAMIEILHNKSKAFSVGQDLNGETNAGISSQSNDGVSITYNTMSASQIYEASKFDLQQTMEIYLYDVKDSNGVRLLYRGYY